MRRETPAAHRHVPRPDRVSSPDQPSSSDVDSEPKEDALRSGSPGGRCPLPSTPRWQRSGRPVAALTAILAVAVFVGVVVGVVSLVGSRTATSLQPVSGAINPPVVGDTTERTGIPYPGAGPAAEIIRGTYRDERAAPPAPVVGDTTDRSGIPYPGTGPAADIIRGGSAGTTERTGIPYPGTGRAAEVIRGTYRDELDVSHVPGRRRHDRWLRHPVPGHRAGGRDHPQRERHHRPVTSLLGDWPGSRSSKPRLRAGSACCRHQSRLARRTPAVPILETSLKASKGWRQERQ